MKLLTTLRTNKAWVFFEMWMVYLGMAGAALLLIGLCGLALFAMALLIWHLLGGWLLPILLVLMISSLATTILVWNNKS